MAQLIGPVSQLTVNSKYYSAKPPPRIRTPTLPHVTIQCPVYKEGLETVIAPTIKSIKQAISTYELQGGTSNIFINDDGMQLISPEERLVRTEFYSDHNIGWVARPKHGVDGFLRRGKFKKVRTIRLFSGYSAATLEKSYMFCGARPLWIGSEIRNTLQATRKDRRDSLTRFRSRPRT